MRKPLRVLPPTSKRDDPQRGHSCLSCNPSDARFFKSAGEIEAVLSAFSFLGLRRTRRQRCMRLEDLIFYWCWTKSAAIRRTSSSASLIAAAIRRGSSSTSRIAAERPDFLDLRRRRFRDDRSRRNSDGTSCGSSYLPRSPCPIISRVASHNDALEGILVFVAR